jgi:hypothetical protein
VRIDADVSPVGVQHSPLATDRVNIWMLIEELFL